MKTSLIFEALSILTSPVQVRKSSSSPVPNSNEKTTDKSLIDDLLETNLQALFSALKNNAKFAEICAELSERIPEENDASDIRWKTVRYCLAILELLKESIERDMELYNAKMVTESIPEETLNPRLKEDSGKADTSAPPLSPDTLSFGQQKTVVVAAQFIVCFGINPCLREGVGIPAEKRAEFGWLLKRSAALDLTLDEKQHRLFICIDTILRLLKISSFSDLIFSKNLNDVLAGLLQICYVPAMSKERPVAMSDDLSSASPAAVVDLVLQPGFKNLKFEEGTVSRGDRNKCLQALQELMKKLHPPLLVRELVMLQGGPGPKQVKGKMVLARAPVWLRKICGRLLSEILCRPKGVIHVLTGILTGVGGNMQVSENDWRKCDAVAKIIANCPMQAVSADEYYKLVGPQIIDLMSCTDSALASQFYRVSCTVVSTSIICYPRLTHEYILSPLFKPLFDCLQYHPVSVSDEVKVWICEDVLINCISHLHKMLEVTVQPSREMQQYYRPLLSVVFKLYCFSRSGVSILKMLSHDVVVRMIRQMEKPVAMETMKSLVFENKTKKINEALHFTTGANGGIQVIVKSKQMIIEEPRFGDYELRVDAIGDLLNKLLTDGLAGDFFIFILTELTKIISVSSETPPMKKLVEPGKELLDIEDHENHSICDIEQKLIIVSLLNTICNTLGDSCLKHAKQVIGFAKATLERGVYILKHTDDELFGLIENETLSMAMGLLTATMGGAMEITAEDRLQFKELLPLLEEIGDCHPNEEIQEMANDIRIAIATYGAVWSEMMKSGATDFGNKPSVKKKSDKLENVSMKQNCNKNQRPLIQEIDSSKDSVELDSREEPDNPDMKFSYDVKGLSQLEIAFKELCDPLIPVRGHALIRLTKLVQAGDEECLAKWETILRIFRENVDHADTYLYLQSVLGLAALAERFPERVVPILIEQFAKKPIDSSTDKSKRRAIEHRIKLGEALVKSSRCLGDMIPKFKDGLINAFLIGARDEDETVRASCLSNLGEVCLLLRYSLGNIIQEVFSCCSSLLKSDESVTVRQSAAFLITQLLRGVGKDAMKILDSILRELYRLLKLIATTEKEETVLIHVGLALEELDEIMKNFLFPKQSLSHQIYVLDAP
ncbi:transport and Golgi organization protein 6 homolog [Tubulanus polymorphus]|uniref:transport and Golgi organization protein 6 homolog n=1 Tax=Tubulanus polymorphus TaxID=672921 RepID=UPI003DA5F8C6